MTTQPVLLVLADDDAPDDLRAALAKQKVDLETGSVDGLSSSLEVVDPDLVVYVGAEKAEEVVELLAKRSGESVRVAFVAPRPRLASLRKLDRQIVATILSLDIPVGALASRLTTVARRLTKSASLPAKPSSAPQAAPAKLPQVKPSVRPPAAGGSRVGPLPSGSDKSDDLSFKDAAARPSKLSQGFAPRTPTPPAPAPPRPSSAARPSAGAASAKLSPQAEVSAAADPKGADASESVAPESVAPESVAPESVAPESGPPESAAPDSLSELHENMTVELEMPPPSAARRPTSSRPQPTASLAAPVASAAPEVDALVAEASASPSGALRRLLVVDQNITRACALSAALGRRGVEVLGAPLDPSHTDWALLQSFRPDGLIADGAALKGAGKIWLQLFQADKQLRTARVIAVPLSRVFDDSRGDVSLRLLEPHLGGGEDEEDDTDRPTLAADPLEFVAQRAAQQATNSSVEARAGDTIPPASTDELFGEVDLDSVPPPGFDDQSSVVDGEPAPRSTSAKPVEELLASSVELHPQIGSVCPSPPDNDASAKEDSTTGVEVAGLRKAQSKWPAVLAGLGGVAAAGAVAWWAMSPPAPTASPELASAAPQQESDKQADANVVDGAPPAQQKPTGAAQGGSAGLGVQPSEAAVAPQGEDSSESEDAEDAEPAEPAPTPAEDEIAPRAPTADGKWVVTAARAPKCTELVDAPEAVNGATLSIGSRAWDRARRALVRGDMESAHQLLCEAVLNHPQSLALEGLAEHYLKLHDPAQAKKWLTQALEHRPQRRKTMELLGDIESQLGDLSEARRLFVEALGVDPSDTDTLEKVAESYVASALTALQSGDLPKAELLARRAATLDPKSARAASALSAAFMEQKFAQLAEGWAQLALSLDPASSLALMVQGDLAMARGDREAARGAYKAATDAEPTNKAAWRRLGGLGG